MTIVQQSTGCNRPGVCGVRIAQSRFIVNTAIRAGGALALVSYAPNFDGIFSSAPQTKNLIDGCALVNNQASLSGGDIAVFDGGIVINNSQLLEHTGGTKAAALSFALIVKKSAS